MMVYNILRLFLYLLVLLAMILKKKTRTFFIKRLFQNIENYEFKKDDAVLFHMSSVGEFNLSQELINRFISKNKKIIISIMTDTGFTAVNKFYSKNKNIKIIYFPLDDYFLLKKLYKSFNIKKTIIIETEIWPNLYNFAEKNGKLYIVNGRITEKKLKSYLKVKKITQKVLDLPEKILVQSEEDRDRYERVGVKKENLVVHKNLKYSIRYEKIDEEKKNEYFKKNVNKDKIKIVCGSTRPGEEKIWLKAFKEINTRKEYQLIIVPRHLNRIEEIKKEIENIFKDSKDIYSLLSENMKTDILIVDKMGVLRDFYQIADFTFVGGTLTNIGVHSILEPLYYGKLPIIGKYYNNIEEIVKEASKMNFIKIIENNDEISEYIKQSKYINTEQFFKENNDIEKIVNELYN